MPTHYKGDPKSVLALDTYIKFTRAANAFESRLLQTRVLEDLFDPRRGSDDPAGFPADG